MASLGLLRGSTRCGGRRSPPGPPCGAEREGGNFLGRFPSLTFITFITDITNKRSYVDIILGHVADTLQVTDPDVFVSSDGGYSWAKVKKTNTRPFLSSTMNID